MRCDNTLHDVAVEDVLLGTLDGAFKSSSANSICTWPAGIGTSRYREGRRSSRASSAAAAGALVGVGLIRIGEHDQVQLARQVVHHRQLL